MSPTPHPDRSSTDRPPIDEEAHSVTTDGEDVDTVEDYWYRSLTDRGATDEAAERLISAVQAHSELAFGTPSKDRIQTLVEEGIEALDLEAEGVTDTQLVKDEMRQALIDGLAGDIPGPVSLPTPYELQVASEPDTPPVQGTTPAAPANAAPAQSGNDSTDSTPMTDSSEQTDSPDTDTSDTDQRTSTEPTPESAGGDGESTAGGETIDFTPGAEDPLDSGADAQTATAQGASAPADDSGPDIDPDTDIETLHGHLGAARVADDLLNEELLAKLGLLEDGEPDEEALELLRDLTITAATAGADEAFDTMEKHLYGHLDDRAQELVFDQTMGEPMKQMALNFIQQIQERASE